MYRSYEDPYKLQKMLRKAVKEYEEAISSGYGPEDLIDELIWIAELKERINFAWQDEEYDSLLAQD